MHARALFVSAALAFSVLPAVAQPCKRGFSAPDRIITAPGAESAAYGDFDEDGRIDVAFTSGYRLAVSANRGGGVFEPVSSEWLPPAYASTPLQGVTDLDRDGHLDLLFGTFLDAWARGRGDGTFAEPVALRLYDGFLSGSRLIDFDHDGFLDVALWTDDEVHFFRAAESGTFAAAGSARFGDSRYLQGERVTAGDFDGDGNVDAVRVAFDFPNGKWVASFLWSAAAPTAAQTEMLLPFASVGTFEPVDLDGDGGEELLGTSADALIALRLANRALTHEALPFPNKPTYAPRHPMVADVDGDGHDDLLFSYGSSAAIAQGIDAGRFAEPVLLGAGGADVFTRADVDGDGVPDIVTTRGADGLYVIYAGGAVAESPPQRLFPLTFDPRRLQLADINGDGRDDVVASGGDANAISVLLNDGAGFFRLAATQDGLGPRVVVADFDGDGHADLAAGPVEQVPVPPVVAFGDGTGRFPAKVELPLARVIGSLRTSAAAAAAGAAVLVIQNGEVRALRVTRAGEVTATTLLPHPANAVVQPFDRNGDGIDEIAMATSSGIEILERTGSTWTAVHRLAAPRSAPQRIVATDLDGDHVDDLFVTFADDAAFYIRNGSGYGPARVVGSWGFFDDAAVADVDGDRHPDLIVASRRNFGEPGLLQVLRNDGLGAFTPYNTSLTGPPHGGSAVVTDVDGDGAPDVLRPVFDGVEMQRNVCVTARVRVAAVPRRVTPGHPVRLVVHASSTDSFAIGGITIRWNGAVVTREQIDRADDYATAVWTSAPLPEGRHVFTVEYLDPFAGPSSTTLTLDVADAPPRRRTVRH